MPRSAHRAQLDFQQQDNQAVLSVTLATSEQRTTYLEKIAFLVNQDKSRPQQVPNFASIVHVALSKAWLGKHNANVVRLEALLPKRDNKLASHAPLDLLRTQTELFVLPSPFLAPLEATLLVIQAAAAAAPQQPFARSVWLEPSARWQTLKLAHHAHKGTPRPTMRLCAHLALMAKLQTLALQAVFLSQLLARSDATARLETFLALTAKSDALLPKPAPDTATTAPMGLSQQPAPFNARAAPTESLLMSIALFALIAMWELTVP